ncbi:MAG: acetyltransferase, partial [Variovorax sp.]|nr:acetyltransferase [Variovorax sp.]
LARSRAQVALAVTGVAGPGGGTPGKPVGTVWFGWSAAGLVCTGHRRFDGERATVRAAAVHHALQTLVALLRLQGEKAMSDIIFTDNTARRRYEAQRDGTLAGFVNYRREGDLIILSHTEVLPAHEGQGLGSALARHVLDEARRQGWRVNPTCGFLAAWIARHDEYLDLVRLDSPPPAAG